MPKIAISKYLLRLREYLNCDDNCFIIGIYYLDKLLAKNKEIKIDKKNAHM